MQRIKIFLAVFLTSVIWLSGCDSNKLDPKNPVTITVWHYYNGALMNAFDALVKEFNDTVGLEQGIIVEAQGMDSPSALEREVLSSARNEVGSIGLPNIFATYADTAYEADKLGVLANIDSYMSETELGGYINSFIEEGRIGTKGELKILPIAKSPEVFLINETDWLPFAAAYNLTYDDLATIEGVARAAELYYEYSGGRAFFGRDSMANLFIIASKQFDVEIFGIKDGVGFINADKAVMRKIWDYYYVPYISGYFYSYGRFRSDDTKVGDILCYVGAASSAAYFPSEVTSGQNVYPISAKVLPAPIFNGAKKVMVQQGAGMAITKSTPQKEYAGAIFLKWFTDAGNNVEFSVMSGYMPVKKEATDYDAFSALLAEKGVSINPIAEETLRVSLKEILTSEMYTNKPFTGAAAAREVLENHLQGKAVKDREAVVEMLDNGADLRETVALFNTDAAFDEWFADLTKKLNEAAGI